MGKVLMCVVEGGSSPRRRECNLFHLGTQRISFLLILYVCEKNHPNCILAIIYTQIWGETIMQQCHVTWCTALPTRSLYFPNALDAHFSLREFFKLFLFHVMFTTAAEQHL